MRVVIAVAALALAGAAPAHHGKEKPKAPVLVRAIVVSGSGQSARAFVAASTAGYVTDFPAPLVVRVLPKPKPGDERHVKFRCVTDRCTFAAADQPNEGKNVEHVLPWVYDVTVDGDGKATLRIAVVTRAVGGAVTIRAEPVADDGERAQSATITLTTR